MILNIFTISLVPNVTRRSEELDVEMSDEGESASSSASKFKRIKKHTGKESEDKLTATHLKEKLQESLFGDDGMLCVTEG